MPWHVLSILPNIDLRFAVEAREAIIVPADDDRVRQLRADHPKFDTYLKRFHTAHGRSVRPAVMLMDASASDARRSAEAMVGLRNCLSIATVLHQTAIELVHTQGHRILYSDPFAFYPWTLDRDFDRMISITPAIMALHRVVDFAGQADPGSPVHTLQQLDVDRHLLSELLAHWDVAYARRTPRPMEQALFRSLNMAQAALGMPATLGATYFDYGRHCGLWISAFEILAHWDSGRSRADLSAVIDLLEKRPFLTPKIRPKRFSVKIRGRPRKVALPAKLYAHLYKVRNDFLHGNPVSGKTLRIPDSGRFIGHFAPSLYRCALRNFLGLRFVSPHPPADLSAGIGARFAEGDYERSQLTAEEALLLARTPPEQEP